MENTISDEPTIVKAIIHTALNGVKTISSRTSTVVSWYALHKTSDSHLVACQELSLV